MKTVVFDFDFTLADSSPAIIECMTFAFQELGLPGRSAAEIRDTIGLTLPIALERLHGPQSATSSTEFMRLFHQHADDVMAPRTRIFEAVPRVLAELRERGHRLGIVSTKRRCCIEDTLALNGLGDAVDVIIGAEDTAVHKPDPAGLIMARRRLLGESRPAIYVGDHKVDGQAAKSADFGFVAVLTGVHDAAAFSEYEPLAIVESVAHVPDVVQ